MEATADVVHSLRHDGFDVSCGYVSYVLRERLIALLSGIGLKPAGRDRVKTGQVRWASAS